jgi:glycosyltransferase involved in cell wall biosynthesis
MWACRRMASNAHQVSLICARGSSATAEKGGLPLPSNLKIIETIQPSWEGKAAEEAHYRSYKDIIEKEFGDGGGIVWDNTWHCFSCLSAVKYPKMKIIHTHHGVAEWQRIPANQMQFPRYIGLSRLHAKYLSSLWKIPVRCVHLGIPVPPKEETRSDKHENYLLSLNRIIPEKGIEDSIDIAIRTGTVIKIVGDDIHVPNHSYVRMIRERCQNAGGLAEYIGLVDNEAKKILIKKCKAVIACPKPSWIEAFGLYALEANVYGKPVLALANGGLNDIIVNQTNGFLANTLEELEGYVDRIPECSAESCRNRIENFFTAERMSKNYLEIFARVMEDDPLFRW